MNFYKKLTKKNFDIWYQKILNTKIIIETLEKTGYSINLFNQNKVHNMLFGRIIVKKQLILINSHLEINKYLSTLIDTIAHEIAHIYIAGHGREFIKLKNIIKNLIKYQIQFN